MKKYVIERNIPEVGTLEGERLRQAAQTSNAALNKLGSDIQWLESFITANKMYCMYLANDEEVIRKHAEISGFPAHKITEVERVIDPTTGA
ncbi:MAG TPA: DUF4242 domain-containing protein [Terriglobales bacterium]